jgi:hypothetical protein
LESQNCFFHIQRRAERGVSQMGVVRIEHASYGILTVEANVDFSEARDILETLAEGFDPQTGEALPDENPYTHPKVIRALYTVLLFLQEAAPNGRLKNHFPNANYLPNAGKPWTAVEDGRLLSAFDEGSKITELAKQHQRTNGAIKSRLARLGRLVPVGYAVRASQNRANFQQSIPGAPIRGEFEKLVTSE